MPCAALRALSSLGPFTDYHARRVLFSSDRRLIVLQASPPTPDGGAPAPADDVFLVTLPIGPIAPVIYGVRDVEWLGNSGDLLATLSPGNELAVVPIDGSGSRVIARDACAHAATPDGSRVFVVRGCTNTVDGPLDEIDVASGVATTRAPLVARDGSLAISPSGRFAAYLTASAPDGGGGGGVLHVLDGNRDQALVARAPAYAPGWVSDQRLLFLDGTRLSGPTDSYVHVPGTGDSGILVAQSRHFGFGGYRISPDRSLVLAATWSNTFPWANTLYAVRLDGSGEQRLTDKMYAYHMNQIGITPFAFTADGARVIYVGPQDSTAGIYTASLDGSTNTRIADGYGFVVSPFADRVAAIDSVSMRDQNIVRVVASATGSGSFKFSTSSGTLVRAPTFVPGDRGLLYVEAPIPGGGPRPSITSPSSTVASRRSAAGPGRSFPSSAIRLERSPPAIPGSIRPDASRSSTATSPNRPAPAWWCSPTRPSNIGALAALDNEVRPSQVTLKTVFTVAFGVLIVIAIVEAVTNATLAVALTGAALLLAVALEHPVRMLERRGIKRPLAIAIVTFAGLALIVGFGFTLIPPAIEQGKALVHDAPQFVRSARGSALFRTLDSRFHLGDYLMEAERRLPELLGGAATPILNALGDLLSGIAAAVTIAFLVIFMLIFGGRLINAAVAEARPERRAMYEDVLAQDLPVDRRLPGRSHADLHDQRDARHQLPRHRPGAVLPAARDRGGVVQHDPLRGAVRRGDRHLADRAVHAGDRARRRVGDLLHPLRRAGGQRAGAADLPPHRQREPAGGHAVDSLPGRDRRHHGGDHRGAGRRDASDRAARGAAHPARAAATRPRAVTSRSRGQLRRRLSAAQRSRERQREQERRRDRGERGVRAQRPGRPPSVPDRPVPMPAGSAAAPTSP